MSGPTTEAGPPDDAGSATTSSTRVRLDVSYDGTDFSGWASQPDRRTVQHTLESALATVLRVPSVALTVAGRTDAGVHATGQVAHCDLLDAPEELLSAVDDRRITDDTLVRRLAGVLPPDVRVRSVRVVPGEFDARFAALWRRYVYRISDAPGGVDPLRRHDVLSWPRRLDHLAMDQAASHLVGLHDFAAFCKRREGATTIRSLLEFQVLRTGDELTCTVRADAFCHSMVRSLVGALIAVGEGRRDPAWPGSLLTLGRRADDVPVAPAHGLTLTEVAYPGDSQLAERGAQTRARRA